MKAYQLSGGEQVLLHGHLWTVDRVRVTRKNKVEVWASRGQRSIKLPLFALEEEIPVPRRADEAVKFDEIPRPNHVHEWTTLWKHLGENMRQDVHTHACTDEHCYHLLLGEGRECNGVLTNHSHEHAANLAAYAIRPPRGDREEQAMQRSPVVKRDNPMKRVVAFLVQNPNRNIDLAEIAKGADATEDQVRRVMSNLKAPSRGIPFGRYIEAVVPGGLWRYTPAEGVDQALGAVKGISPHEPEPPMPDEPGDKLPPDPKPGPVEPKVPTPRDVAAIEAESRARQNAEWEAERASELRQRIVDDAADDVGQFVIVGRNRDGNTVYRSPSGELGVLRWEAL